MHVLTISFLTIAIVLLIFFVIISFTFVGLILSEIGMWFSWIPLTFSITAIPYLVKYSYEYPRVDLFLLLLSVILNLITYTRLMFPFLRANIVNKKLRKEMEASLGENYLEIIDPKYKSNIITNVRFRLSHYFSGFNYKRADKHVISVNDIKYKETDTGDLKLNVYYPNKEGTFPVIIYVHGGGWLIGSKDRRRDLRIMKKLAYMGFTVFNIDYRLADIPTLRTIKEIPHDNPTIREMVSDVRSSILFVKDNATKYQGDPSSVFLFGRSAGAHLVLLTAFSCEEKFFDLEGITCSIDDLTLNGIIAFYPATDLIELNKFYEGEGSPFFKISLHRGTGASIEESSNLYKIFSPINYVNEENRDRIPPVFTAVGSKDRIFNAYQSEELEKELEKLGLTSVLLEIPWANHGFDAIINGPGGQLVFQYLMQFIAWAITKKPG